MKILRQDPDYILLQNTAELAEVLEQARRAGDLVFDLETTGLKDVHRLKIVGIGLGYQARTAYYLPVLGEGWSLPWEEVRKVVAPVLEDPNVHLHGHNILVYDAQVLYWNGVRCQGLQDDTLVAFRVLQSEYFSAGLDPLVLRYFNYLKIPTSTIIGTGRKQVTMDKLPIEKVGIYCCEDVDFSFRLRERILAEIEQQGLWDFYKVFRKINQILFNMYAAGITVDMDQLQKLDDSLKNKLESLSRKLKEVGGEDFNPNAPQQKATLLYDKLGLAKKHRLRIPKTATGKRQVTADIVSTLSEKEGPGSAPAMLLEYAKATKIRGTYSQGLKKVAIKHGDEYRIHTTFNPGAVSTGRLSSQKPNLQNIPRPDNPNSALGKTLRHMFIASPGTKLVGGDLSQIELRLLAHFSQDYFLLDCYKRGLDIHTMMASKVFKVDKPTKSQRSSVKTVTFGIVYGMGPFRLAKELSIDIREAEALIQVYFDNFPGIKDYLDATVAFAKEHGYVPNLFGRRRYTPFINSPDSATRIHARNRAVNHPIQSTVAHMIERAMIAVDEEFTSGRFDGEMKLQIHDEIITQIKEEQAKAFAVRLKEIMEGVATLSVPIVADVGIADNWEALK